MDKQHLTANIASALGAIVVLLQVFGVKTPNVDVNQTAQALGIIVAIGGAMWSTFRSHALVKQAANNVPAPTPEQQPHPAPEQPQQPATPAQ